MMYVIKNCFNRTNDDILLLLVNVLLISCHINYKHLMGKVCPVKIKLSHFLAERLDRQH